MAGSFCRALSGHELRTGPCSPGPSRAPPLPPSHSRCRGAGSDPPSLGAQRDCRGHRRSYAAAIGRERGHRDHGRRYHQRHRLRDCRSCDRICRRRPVQRHRSDHGRSKIRPAGSLTPRKRPSRRPSLPARGLRPGSPSAQRGRGWGGSSPRGRGGRSAAGLLDGSGECGRPESAGAVAGTRAVGNCFVAKVVGPQVPSTSATPPGTRTRSRPPAQHYPYPHPQHERPNATPQPLHTSGRRPTGATPVAARSKGTDHAAARTPVSHGQMGRGSRPSGRSAHSPRHHAGSGSGGERQRACRRWIVRSRLTATATGLSPSHVGGRPPGFDGETYKQRNTIERCINRLNSGEVWPCERTSSP